MTKADANEAEEFLKKFSQLDISDQAVAASVIKTLLNGEKYSIKNRIQERTGNVISVDFARK